MSTLHLPNRCLGPLDTGLAETRSHARTEFPPAEEHQDNSENEQDKAGGTKENRLVAARSRGCQSGNDSRVAMATEGYEGNGDSDHDKHGPKNN